MVFRQDIAKQVYIALGSAAFAALGAWILFGGGLGDRAETGRGLFVGWLSLISGSIFLINAIGQVVRPATLTLNAEGFTVQRWRGRQDTTWRDVAEITVWSSRGTNMVTWRLNDGVRTTDAMASINAHFGYDGALGTGWQTDARSIVEIMNEFKTRSDGQTAG